MRRTNTRRAPQTSLVFGLLLTAGLLTGRFAHATACNTPAGLSTCFDANSLWLPAGHATFLSVPDTRATEVGQFSFGVATELVHRPVVLHAESPDRDGRDIQVVDYAIDSSFFLGFGVIKELELSVTASTRLYQTGAGVGGVSSQAAGPVDRSAVRNPRVGLGYSLDKALATRGLGMRLALDAALPLGEAGAFASERSIVAMPSTTVGWQISALRVTGSLGIRLRSPVDFGGTRLNSQGFAALAVGVELLDPGWLFLSLEAYGLPSLSSSRTNSPSTQVTDAHLFPAEWLGGLHSTFGSSDWTLSLGAGSGLPFSSETLQASGGPVTNHFLGLTTPDFRSLLVLRYAPARQRSAAQ